jgi:DNA mismatch repair ATPase MutS
MRRNLKSYEKFYDHPGYKDWYERTLIRNQSAYEIKRDYELFKDALNLNRVSDRALEKLATQHEWAILVKDYLAQSQERVFKKVKTIAPELAKTFEKINAPIKEVTINWASEEFNDEFDALRKSKDSNHQYLVKFRDKLKDDTYKQYEKMLTKQLDSLAMNIGEVKSRQESLKKLAPNLSAKLEAFVKFKTRQKEIGRDFD